MKGEMNVGRESEIENEDRGEIIELWSQHEVFSRKAIKDEMRARMLAGCHEPASNHLTVELITQRAAQLTTAVRMSESPGSWMERTQTLCILEAAVPIK